MATKKDEAAEEIMIDRGEERVEFMIPRTGPDDKPVLIGVNGEFIRIRPGEQVSVKRKFVEAYMNSVEAKREAWKTQDRAAKLSRKALAEL